MKEHVDGVGTQIAAELCRKFQEFLEQDIIEGISDCIEHFVERQPRPVKKPKKGKKNANTPQRTTSQSITSAPLISTSPSSTSPSQLNVYPGKRSSLIYLTQV
jgi:hypothetical protein